MRPKIVLFLMLLSLVDGKQFICPQKICTEQVFSSLTPCTYTNIDDKGECLCTDNCPVVHRKEGTCNEITCKSIGTSNFVFWLYLILSTFSGSFASYLFSKR